MVYVGHPWPDEVVPPDMPSYMYYEVVKEHDAVTRRIDEYPDGSLKRFNIKEDPFPDQRAPEHRSLVHGGFFEMLEEEQEEIPALLETVSEAQFEELWRRAVPGDWE